MIMNCSFDSDNKEQKLFYAKLSDLAKRADSGSVAHSDFLTPGEQYRAEKYFSAKEFKDKICFFGGYFAAERKQIFLLPEYMSDALGYDGSRAEDLLSEDFSSAVSAFKIMGSGYRKLSHRDYLGSILSLGIERSSIGDICPIDDFSAVVFCCREIEGLILSELSAIANDKVKVESTEPDVNMPSPHKFEPFSDTVASERLDCVVASFCNLSREKAQALIKSGLVEHNYEPNLKIDAKVSKNDIISARGYGKFSVKSISEQTKKGRIRLFADKYV